MVKRSLTATKTLLLVSLSFSGCSAAPKPKPDVAVAESQGRPEIEHYLPLENGTVFSYDTTSEATGTKGVLIVQISRPRQDRVDLRMGAKVERLEITNEGVAYVEGGYLLKAPVVTGSTWKSKTGTTRIESADLAVSVPAGKFDSCIRTVEETREPGASRTVRTVFCPHVGLVSIDVEATSDRGLERETAVLRSFGPRVDIAPGEVTTTTTTDE